MKKIIKIRLIFIGLVLFWMIFIYILSSQNNIILSKINSRIYEKIAVFINPNFETLAVSEKLNLIGKINNYASKIAHLTEYFILGMLCMFAIKAFINIKQRFQALFSVGICFIYAFSDELHQAFVIGR
ncbi:MAG: VanZ family protein [Clostridia bacterium]|nr:VanZ family protein [Clostridia bacterium]